MCSRCWSVDRSCCSSTRASFATRVIRNRWRPMLRLPMLPLAKAEVMSQRYQQSESLLERALRTIPLGTQTFSKSRTQYPFGASPYFVRKGRGSHVWDVDGHEYID